MTCALQLEPPKAAGPFADPVTGASKAAASFGSRRGRADARIRLGWAATAKSEVAAGKTAIMSAFHDLCNTRATAL
jgi:hypothetical protein